MAGERDVLAELEAAFTAAVNAPSVDGRTMAVPHYRDVQNIWYALNDAARGYTLSRSEPLTDEQWNEAYRAGRAAGITEVIDSRAAPSPEPPPLDVEKLREAIHDYFTENNEEGCVHFDKGYGLFRLCDDPDQDVPHRALPAIFAAAIERYAADRMGRAIG